MYLALLVIGAFLAVTAILLVRQDLAQTPLNGAKPIFSVPKSATSASTYSTQPRAKDVKEPGKDKSFRSRFDVVRIDPGGASVFAGRAPANSKVVILANGQPVAMTQANQTGEWAIVTEREFAPADYELSLNVVSPDDVDSTVGPPVHVTVRGSPSTLSPPREGASYKASHVPQSLPMPITFVYNQSTLTTKGHKAAAQIAQYLIARRSKTALLSGHADERGSDLYNMQLSRARLQVVANYLREQGFSGQLELQAKGKSEPFAGVDRRSLSREQAFELDRRVELRVAN